MSGICGIIHTQKTQPREVAQAMANRLTHRGPDGQTIQRLPACDLALSWMGPEGGGVFPEFPSEPSGRYTVVLDGALTNREALRESLGSEGKRLEGCGDEALIGTAFARWGRNCLQRFEGAFAFLLWDKARHLFFAARDRLGQKPLFYGMGHQGTLLFASEIKALLASGLMDPKLDIPAVDACLALGFVPPDRSVFRGIQPLPAGHFLEWVEREIRVYPWWRPRFSSRFCSLEEGAEQLATLLRRVLAPLMEGGGRQLWALDGADLLLLRALEKEGMPPGAVHSAPDWFPGGFPISTGAKPALKPEAGPGLLERWAQQMDEPYTHPDGGAFFALADEAAENRGLSVSALGAAALLGGYEDLHPPLALSEKEGPRFWRWLALKMAQGLLLRRKEDGLSLRALEMANRWPDCWTRQVMASTRLGSQRRRLWWGRRSGRLSPFLPGEAFSPPDGLEGLNRAFYFDLKGRLPGKELAQWDGALGAYSLEGRLPFLQEDMVEFALTLPPELKVEKEETLRVLRRAVSAEPGPSRPGQGPDFSVLGHPSWRPLLARVFSEDGPLRRLLPGLSGNQQHRREEATWALLLLGLWLEKHPGYLPD